MASQESDDCATRRHRELLLALDSLTQNCSGLDGLKVLASNLGWMVEDVETLCYRYLVALLESDRSLDQSHSSSEGMNH